MCSEAAKLLDELMGRHRNLSADEKPQLYSYDSPEICRMYLAKLCPHDLFINTKADLGPCDYIHDAEVKEQFSKLPAYKRAQYEDEYLHEAQSLINDIERKIKKARERLELRPVDTKQNTLATPQYKGNEEKINMLTEKINGLLQEAEALGCKGQVEEAQGLMKLYDNLRNERDELKKANDSSMWHTTAEIAACQEKQMDVCKVCGSFLIVGDAQQRIDDHLQGKIHRGYARLRESLDEISAEREDERKKMEEKRSERRKNLDNEDDKARSRYRNDYSRHSSRNQYSPNRFNSSRLLPSTRNDSDRMHRAGSGHHRSRHQMSSESSSRRSDAGYDKHRRNSRHSEEEHGGHGRHRSRHSEEEHGGHGRHRSRHSEEEHGGHGRHRSRHSEEEHGGHGRHKSHRRRDRSRESKHARSSKRHRHSSSTNEENSSHNDSGDASDTCGRLLSSNQS